HYAQQLFQQLATMERRARLYAVLNDATLLKDYSETRTQFLVTLEALDGGDQQSVRANQIRALRASLRKIDAVLLAPQPLTPNAIRDALDTFTPMSDAAFSLSSDVGEQIETGLSQLQKSTADTQRYLFWQSAALIVLTALLVAVFTLRLMNPIRQIDGAISM